MEKSMHNFVLRDKLDVWPFGVSHVYISPETDERKKRSIKTITNMINARHTQI